MKKHPRPDTPLTFGVLARWIALLAAAFVSANWILSAVRRNSPAAPEPSDSYEEVDGRALLVGHQ